MGIRGGGSCCVMEEWMRGLSFGGLLIHVGFCEMRMSPFAFPRSSRVHGSNEMLAKLNCEFCKHYSQKQRKNRWPVTFEKPPFSFLDIAAPPNFHSSKESNPARNLAVNANIGLKELLPPWPKRITPNQSGLPCIQLEYFDFHKD